MEEPATLEPPTIDSGRVFSGEKDHQSYTYYLFSDHPKVLKTEEGLLEFKTTQSENTRGDRPDGWDSLKLNLPHPSGTTVPVWLLAVHRPGAL